jgi:replicative DNA helicase
MQTPNTIIERAKHVLGTILIDPGMFWQVSDLLTPVMMPSDALRSIAEVTWERVYNAKPFDFTIVTDETGLDVSYLRDYYSGAITDHAEAVRENFLRKQVSTGMQTLAMNMQEGRPVSEAVQMFLNEYDLLNQNFQGRTKPMDAFNAVKDYVLSKDRSQYLGIPTGFADLDEYTGGYKPGKLYVIGGNPGQGKTTIMLASALAAAKAGKNTLIFSLEMMLEDLILLLGCMDAGTDHERMVKNQMSDIERQELCESIDGLYELPLIIFDLSMIDNTIEAIASKVYGYHAKGECDAVYIDYLQLMTARAKYSSKEEEVSSISRLLKVMSAKAKCPVVVLSQLNREHMKRATKRPDIGDLRYSSQIQADADFIGLPYRPELYGIIEDEEGNSLAGVTEFTVGKFRQLGAKQPMKFFWEFRNSNLRPLQEVDAEPISDMQANRTMVQHAPEDGEELPF